VSYLRRLGLAVLLTALPALWPAAALAVDAADDPAAAIRPIPDLHLSISEVPGETTVRVPLATQGYRLYGLLSPYLSLGAATTL
jgi:hypothetical protein